jgi:hypothetical protein
LAGWFEEMNIGDKLGPYEILAPIGEGGDSARRSSVKDLGDKELLTLVELRLNQGLKWADR